MHPLFAIAAAHNPNAWVPQGASRGALGQVAYQSIPYAVPPAQPMGFAGGLSASDRAEAKALAWRMMDIFMRWTEHSGAEDPPNVNQAYGLLQKDDGRWLLGAAAAMCMTGTNEDPKFNQIRIYVHDNALEWWGPQQVPGGPPAP